MVLFTVYFAEMLQNIIQRFAQNKITFQRLNKYTLANVTLFLRLRLGET